MGTVEFNLDNVYPLESSDDNKIYPFYDSLKKGTLTTTRCRKCGEKHWPPRTLCPACWSNDLEWVDLPKTGEIDCFVTQVAGLPPGFESPLVLAVIKVGGVKIFSQIVDTDPNNLRDGTTVELKVQQVSDGRVIPFWRATRGRN